MPGLPKTRSEKIMRQNLRKKAKGELSDLGDMSTLADPEIVEYKHIKTDFRQRWKGKSYCKT